MTLAGEHTLLRIFADSRLRHHQQPAYEVLPLLARERGLAGATALASIEGFGQAGALLKPGAWNLAEQREMIVEIADARAKLEAFLEAAQPLLAGCIVTLERAKVIFYGAEAKA